DLRVHSFPTRRSSDLFSIRLLISTESVKETPGSLRVSIRIEPSSSLGMNSVPIKNKDPTAIDNTTMATATVCFRLANPYKNPRRSEEHTSELQSLAYL